MRTHLLSSALLAAVVLALHGPAPAQEPVTTAAQAPAESFNAMIDRQTQETINTDPELRTMLGITGDGVGDLSDQLVDVSLPRRAELHDRLAQYRAEIKAVERDTLVGQERFTHDMTIWFYDRQLELMSPDWAPAWLPLGSVYAVDQLFSSAVQLPDFMDTHHVVVDETDARNYIARLGAIATKLDQIGQNLDMQAGQGMVPPAVALEGAAEQFRGLLEPEPEQSPFVLSLERKLDALPEMSPELRQTLLDDATRAVAERTNPGYRRLLGKLQAALATDPGNNGIWSVPGGDAYYNAALRWNTSTDLDADEIHRIGVAEVARIEREMDALLTSQGYADGTVAERIKTLADVPALNYEDSDAGRTELLADIDRILAAIEPQVPEYFSRVPTQALEVKRVPEHAEQSAPGGYYYPPALDGSRPGTFYINLADINANTRWNLPTLVYHEGSPGHHFQISLGQTIEGLPFLRRNLNPSAYTEGWALYAEQLVDEMGVYDDNPMGNLGRLQAEMFRAVRLVVDTGLHRKRWSMEQAMDYMAANTGMTPSEVRIEISRYLVQPGQATSYKIGHMKLVQIRERARKRLGEEFDIRAFHDVVLGNGALPLMVLEKVVEEWAALLAEGLQVHAGLAGADAGDLADAPTTTPSPSSSIPMLNEESS
ncbi:DUF885 domain-containing protein [Lysobacter sp. A421]